MTTRFKYESEKTAQQTAEKKETKTQRIVRYITTIIVVGGVIFFMVMLFTRNA